MWAQARPRTCLPLRFLPALRWVPLYTAESDAQLAVSLPRLAGSDPQRPFPPSFAEGDSCSAVTSTALATAKLSQPPDCSSQLRPSSLPLLPWPLPFLSGRVSFQADRHTDPTRHNQQFLVPVPGRGGKHRHGQGECEDTSSTAPQP